MKRRDEILVGLFTTAAVVILVVGTIWLLRGGLEKGYPLYGTFPWGSGLKEGQPVWLSGVTVGFVDDVDLLQDGRLTVTFRIQDKYKVPLGSTAAIVPNGFFGDVAIALRPKAPNLNSFEEGDTVPSEPGAAGLQVLASRADTLSQTMQVILGSTRSQLVDSGGLREMRLMMQSLNRTATQLSRAVDVQSRQLEATLATVRSRVAAVDSVRVDSTMRAIQTASQNFNEASDQLKQTSIKLNTLLTKADSGTGSLAKLLNDDKLYTNVVSLSARFDTLLFDFRKNPRRYVNLSIFGR
ncbi:MAG TPA: MlaD family protein [Gemmatimonadaceae bacterium]|nr:MlaD family protein [Gemmatimonadaceae bacterium]